MLYYNDSPMNTDKQLKNIIRRTNRFSNENKIIVDNNTVFHCVEY